jgi:hypothetical protein
MLFDFDQKAQIQAIKRPPEHLVIHRQTNIVRHQLSQQPFLVPVPNRVEIPAVGIHPPVLDQRSPAHGRISSPNTGRRPHIIRQPAILNHSGPHVVIVKSWPAHRPNGAQPLRRLIRAVVDPPIKSRVWQLHDLCAQLALCIGDVLINELQTRHQIQVVGREIEVVPRAKPGGPTVLTQTERQQGLVMRRGLSHHLTNLVGHCSVPGPA